MKFHLSAKKIISDNKGLLIYTFLNYVDKFVIFCSPLLVLFIFKDKTQYNELEYIYSLASIAAVIIELGVRNYFLFEYKNSANREATLESVDGFFALQFTVYLIIGSCLSSLLNMTKHEISSLFFFITIRALFNYYISFYSIYYRLIDKPSKIFISSILVNLFTFLTSFIVWFYTKKIEIQTLLAAQTLFIFCVSFSFIKKTRAVNTKSMKIYITNAFKYAWPITINIILTMFISNYGKIYSRNILGPEEMTYISLIQRISMFIQLGHASAAGYYTKQIFLENNKQTIKKIFIEYSCVLLLCVLFAISALAIIKSYFSNIKLELNHISFLIIGYTVFWCYSAFFEIYVNKKNRNIYIPIGTILSSIIFGIVVFFGKWPALSNISIAMFVSALFNCIFMIMVFIKK